MSQLERKPSNCFKVFRCFSRVNALISRSLEGLHSAIFMGLMNDRFLQSFDTYPFGGWEGARDVATDLNHVADWLDHFMTNQIPLKSRVLVVGAGGGRELITLARLGHSGFGVEFDDGLFDETSAILAATPEGAAINFRHAERFHLDDLPVDFDVVLIPRFYTSYVQGRVARIRFLRKCRERLKEDGVIAFDFFTRPDASFSPGALIFRIQPPISNFLRLIKGGRNRRIETGDHLDPQVPLLHHHYNQSGLDLELAESGLEPADSGRTWFGWVVAKPSASGLATAESSDSVLPEATAGFAEHSGSTLPASV